MGKINIKQIPVEIFDSFQYCEKSPSGLIWAINIKAGNKYNVKIGDIAGTLTSSGYYRVVINGVSYMNHRIVYLMHNRCENQSFEIDHIDRNRQNNVISNLRKVDRILNNRNSNMRSDNTSGITGVAKRILRDKEYWVCNYHRNGKQIYNWFSC